jgi:hypothetical protein
MGLDRARRRPQTMYRSIVSAAGPKCSRVAPRLGFELRPIVENSRSTGPANCVRRAPSIDRHVRASRHNATFARTFGTGSGVPGQWHTRGQSRQRVAQLTPKGFFCRAAGGCQYSGYPREPPYPNAIMRSSATGCRHRSGTPRPQTMYRCIVSAAGPKCNRVAPRLGFELRPIAENSRSPGPAICVRRTPSIDRHVGKSRHNSTFARTLGTGSGVPGQWHTRGQSRQRVGQFTPKGFFCRAAGGCRYSGYPRVCRPPTQSCGRAQRDANTNPGRRDRGPCTVES